MKKRVILFLLILFASTQLANAWGNKGHVVTVQVARNQMHQSIIDSINYYLNGTQWETAVTWMIEAHKSADYNYMMPWHSINIPRDKTYVRTDQPNVMNRIEYCLSVLKSRALYPRQEVSVALMVLMHLVGDLHQPLNCGYPDDKGGKRTQVEFMGRKVSLYKVWESEIIEERSVDQWDGARINLAMSRIEVGQMKYGNINDWLDESRGMLPQVYDFNDGFITTDYINRNKVLIAKQLVKAGMRMANLLTSCFKVGSRCTF